MPEETRRITFAGEELVLLPERAVSWPARRVMMLADVHFGKSATFRASGIPVPEGECQADLARISDLVERHQIRQLVIIGDFYHSGIALTDSLTAMLAGFRDTLGAEIILVRGNHDAPRHRLLPMRGRLDLPPFRIVHDPADATQAKAAITGHLHPLCRIARSRLPCFLVSETLLVLPAFGTFTSGHVVHPKPGLSIYPVINRSVYQIPERTP